MNSKLGQETNNKPEENSTAAGGTTTENNNSTTGAGSNNASSSASSSPSSSPTNASPVGNNVNNVVDVSGGGDGTNNSSGGASSDSSTAPATNNNTNAKDESAEPLKIPADQRSQDYKKLIKYGLDEKVAAKLDDIYNTGIIIVLLSTSLSFSVLQLTIPAPHELDIVFLWRLVL